MSQMLERHLGRQCLFNRPVRRKDGHQSPAATKSVWSLRFRYDFFPFFFLFLTKDSATHGRGRRKQTPQWEGKSVHCSLMCSPHWGSPVTLLMKCRHSQNDFMLKENDFHLSMAVRVEQTPPSVQAQADQDWGTGHQLEFTKTALLTLHSLYFCSLCH
jgi:hypothetical protein